MFDYNCFGDHHVVRSSVELAPGPGVVGVRFRRTGSLGHGHPGGRRRRGRARSRCPFAMRMISSVGASVGYDHGSPVSTAYDGEFPFEGRLERVDIQLVSPGAADEAAVAERGPPCPASSPDRRLRVGVGRHVERAEVGGHVHRVALEHLEGHQLEHGLVGGGQHHRRRGAVVVGPQPVRWP